MTNPFESPSEECSKPNQSPAGKASSPPFYAYVVASIGAILVFAGALACLLIAPALLPLPPVSIVAIAIYTLIAFLLAVIAGASSFLATMKTYAKKKSQK
jgi:hypothetical protein